ncbi:MAG: non-canonical purine NTP diphosphatase [Bacteroidales bacterium]|nr:non-canonical purine NTP diphosphatase [Bacteroidales bacterium]
MTKIVFATNNKHKLEEIKQILKDKFEILSLNDIGCNEDIPEDKETISENASQKALYVFNKYKITCFADDTGLEIEALNGKPGVHSARYASEKKDFDENIDKVLLKMQGAKNREARFLTVISLIIDGKEVKFEGIVNGTILEERRGTGGFGYDPIFQPTGFSKTFAEMTMEEKNGISHRGIAVKKLVNYLNNL